MLLGLLACATRTPPRAVAIPSKTDVSIVAPKGDLYLQILRHQLFTVHNNPKESALTLEHALKIDPHSALIHIRLAQDYFKLQEYAQAETRAKQAIELCPGCRDAHSMAGRIYHQKQDFAAAEKEFQRSLSLDVDDSGEDVLALTNIYLTQKQPEKAVGILKEFVARNPDDEMAHYYLGRVYSETNQIPDAVATYKQIIELNPEFPHSYKALGIIHEFQGEGDKAFEYYATALRLEPDNVELAKHVATLSLDLKRYEDAKEALTIVARLAPADAEARMRLGLLALKAENYAEAKAIFERAERSKPVPDAVRYYLGIIYEKERDYPRAIRMLRAVGPAASMFSESQQAAALILESQGRTREADRTLARALQQKPGDVPLTVLLAKLMGKQRKFTEATALLDRGLLANPKEQAFWFASGEIHDDAGNFPRAVDCLKKVIELNPDHANALNYLGYSYAQKGVNLKEAEQLIQRALKIRPKDGYITDSLGWIYYKMGAFETAVGKLREATTLAPGEATILEHLGDALLKLGNSQEAKKAYEQALENYKEPVDRRRLGTKLQIFRSR